MDDKNNNNDNEILRFNEIKKIIGNISRSTIDRWEVAGSFPKRIKIGKSIVGWRAIDLYDWVKTKQINNKKE